MLKKYVIKMGANIFLAFYLFLYACLTYGFWWVTERTTNEIFAAVATFIFVAISIMGLFIDSDTPAAAIEKLEENGNA